MCVGTGFCIQRSGGCQAVCVQKYREETGSEICQGPWDEMQLFASDAMSCRGPYAQHILHALLLICYLSGSGPGKENIPFSALSHKHKGPDLRAEALKPEDSARFYQSQLLEGFQQLLPCSSNEVILQEGRQAAHTILQGVQGHSHQAQHL